LFEGIVSNPKPEIRNPKQTPKAENNKSQTATPCVKEHGVAVWDLPFWILEFVSGFEFRVSDLQRFHRDDRM